MQDKPEHIRKQILVITLIISMSVVVLIWIGSIGYSFGHKKDVAKGKEAAQPFALLGQSITDTVKSISASVGSISSPTVEPKEEAVATKEQQIDLTPVEQRQ